MNRFELMQKGGKWLAAAREHIQWYVKGGDTCTWGSLEELTMTVKRIEEVAAAAAAAAINEYKCECECHTKYPTTEKRGCCDREES